MIGWPDSGEAYRRRCPLNHDASNDTRERVARLGCWSGEVDPQPLGGGITNTNFVIQDGSQKFVVRVGEDLPLHGILRVHELAAARAAHAAGLAPEIVHHEPGVLVMQFIEGKTLTAEAVRNEDMLVRLVDVMRRCHTQVEDHLYGATPMFWVFHVCRSYLRTVREGDSRWHDQLDRMRAANAELEEAIGEIRPVFCHNDLLPSNFIDDGKKIWLVDWEYAGWNTALFDLANLASNCALPTDLDRRILEIYFGAPPDSETIQSYQALKCASLLRETLWSMVQELHSQIDFDYAAYSDENFANFESAYREYRAST